MIALGWPSSWAEISVTEVGIFFLARDAGGDDTGSHRDEQGGDLGDEAVTDGEKGIGLGRLQRGHAVHGHADDQSRR